jgi:hypothetical protein
MNDSFITALVGAEIYRIPADLWFSSSAKRKYPNQAPIISVSSVKNRDWPRKLYKQILNMRELILLGLLGIAKIQPWDSLSASRTHPQSCN